MSGEKKRLPLWRRHLRLQISRPKDVFEQPVVLVSLLFGLTGALFCLGDSEAVALCSPPLENINSNLLQLQIHIATAGRRRGGGGGVSLRMRAPVDLCQVVYLSSWFARAR